ncbi:hypothetical protein D3C83_210100 [compost metagenome]
MIATVIATGSGAMNQLPNVKMSPMSASTTMCPPVMFAKRRTASAKIFVNFPSSSIGVMISVRGAFIANGMSCGQ